jgi:hypothetical protein
MSGEIKEENSLKHQIPLRSSKAASSTLNSENEDTELLSRMEKLLLLTQQQMNIMQQQLNSMQQKIDYLYTMHLDTMGLVELLSANHISRSSGMDVEH